MENQKIHPIRHVALRTGLSAHVIRAWERRYGAVKPKRTRKNRRLYSEADIERLNLLNKAKKDGHSIGQLARLPKKALQELIRQGETVSATAIKPVHDQIEDSSPRHYYEACLAAVLDLDAHALNQSLSRASVRLTRLSLVEQVVAPLVQEIGDLWAEGSLKVANEHMVSAVIRSFLGDILRSSEVPPRAPKMIIATPSGQWHELGALMAATVAATLGWQAIYLGSNLPAEEIVAAVEKTGASVVALSIVYPEGDPMLDGELKKLRRYLPASTVIILGGRAVQSSQGILNETEAINVPDIQSLPDTLETLCSRAKP
jgi:DNA-binding transcriptional MerR regulator/methylmalonyl-CoA mutase cobalamin-binding subunit